MIRKLLIAATLALTIAASSGRSAAASPAAQATPATGNLSPQHATERARMQQRLAGGQANSVDDLGVLIQQTCDVQPWQFALRALAGTHIRLENSPTLDVAKVHCIQAVINQSKFSLAPGRN